MVRYEWLSDLALTVTFSPEGEHRLQLGAPLQSVDLRPVRSEMLLAASAETELAARKNKLLAERENW
jgi:hypothetical protein